MFIKGLKMTMPNFSQVVSDTDFALWAFGDVWKYYLVYDADSTDLMNAWNNHHGDFFKLKDTDLITESMQRMKQLYEEHGKNQSSTVEKSNKRCDEAQQAQHIPSGLEAADMGGDARSNKNPKTRGTYGQDDAQGNRENEDGRKGRKKGQAKSGRKSTREGRKEE